jgi:hypothetical protein
VTLDSPTNEIILKLTHYQLLYHPSDFHLIPTFRILHPATINMKKITSYLIPLIILGVLGYWIFRFVQHGLHDGAPEIKGAYYFESDKGKIIVLNTVESFTQGGGGQISHYSNGRLIQLDAVTGKELKRLDEGELEYIGTNNGKLWMVSSDSTVRMHTRDPYSLAIVESYKSFLEKAEAKNPVFKNRIASVKADEYTGNILITSLDALTYYVNPITFETRPDDDNKKAKIFDSVGMMEQDQQNYMAYTESAIYELDGEGQRSNQLFHLDQYHLSPRDARCGSCRPDEILKRHVIGDHRFIDGAFVYDAYTRKPLQFAGDSAFFIYHLNQIGKDAREIFTEVDASGNVKTEYDITQTDPSHTLINAFIADGRLYLVFENSVQARDASGKLLWEFISK